MPTGGRKDTTNVKFEPSRKNHIYPLRIYDAQGNLKQVKSTEELTKESWDTFHSYDDPRLGIGAHFEKVK